MMTVQGNPKVDNRRVPSVCSSDLHFRAASNYILLLQREQIDIVVSIYYISYNTDNIQ